MAWNMAIPSVSRQKLATFRRKNPSFIFDRAKHHPRAGDSLFASAD
jgi:hypothetical protein